MSNQNILQAIANRRSIGRFTTSPVAQEKIEQLILAGAWAPNHHKTEPFRFVVFSGEGRQQLQQAWVAGVRRQHAHLPEAEITFRLEKIAGKTLRAPVIILVWAACGRSAQKNPPVWEDIAATAACLQNMSLAAEALELGSIWRTGDVVNLPEVQALCVSQHDRFNAEKGDAIIGLLYVGSPDPATPKPQRSTPQTAPSTRWVTGA